MPEFMPKFLIPLYFPLVLAAIGLVPLMGCDEGLETAELGALSSAATVAEEKQLGGIEAMGCDAPSQICTTDDLLMDGYAPERPLSDSCLEEEVAPGQVRRITVISVDAEGKPTKTAIGQGGTVKVSVDIYGDSVKETLVDLLYSVRPEASPISWVPMPEATALADMAAEDGSGAVSAIWKVPEIEGDHIVFRARASLPGSSCEHDGELFVRVIDPTDIKSRMRKPQSATASKHSASTYSASMRARRIPKTSQRASTAPSLRAGELCDDFDLGTHSDHRNTSGDCKGIPQACEEKKSPCATYSQPDDGRPFSRGDGTPYCDVVYEPAGTPCMQPAPLTCAKAGRCDGAGVCIAQF